MQGGVDAPLRQEAVIDLRAVSPAACLLRYPCPGLGMGSAEGIGFSGSSDNGTLAWVVRGGLTRRWGFENRQ